MSKIVIQVEIKSVYGVSKAYPANPAAEALANIAGTKTLSAYVLNQARGMGMEVQELLPSRLKEIA